MAHYVAVSVRETAYDVALMAKTFTKVFIMDVMVRHAGWIDPASDLAGEKKGEASQIKLSPEIAFDAAERVCHFAVGAPADAAASRSRTGSA